MYRATKYHATKVRTDDGVFDSKKEYARFTKLKELEANGGITELQRQVKFELIPSQKDAFGKTIERPVSYIADFVYKVDGRTVVEDTKGVKTPEYIIKRKLMLSQRGIKIKEV